MKKIIATLLIGSILFSCKKSNDATPAVNIPEVVYKIKTLTSTTGTTTFTYDTQGRIIVETTSSNNSKFEYTYTANTVTQNYYIGTTLNFTKVYEINADGLVTKSSNTFPLVNVPYITTFTYNANKQTVARIGSNTLNNDVVTRTNFYTGKTLDSSRTTFSNNNNIYRYYYTYYTDKKNTTNFKNRGTLFNAEESSMPIKQIVYKEFLFGVNKPPQIEDYTYIFDAQNRIIQQTHVASNPGPSTNIISFTYY
jgi:YD repeat-containing protein